MPVATWSTKARKVALPNTYHHPVRGGTGCSSACRVQVTRPLRSSIQARSLRMRAASGDRDGARLDLDLTRRAPAPGRSGAAWAADPRTRCRPRSTRRRGRDRGRAAPSAIQRTGQPRWVQCTEYAVKRVASSRRSHAAVRAVTPDHGSAEASSNRTFTVSPMAKSSTRPTARHTRGSFRVSGARRKPTTGSPSRAPIAPESTTESLERKRRRSGGSGESGREGESMAESRTECARGGEPTYAPPFARTSSRMFIAVNRFRLGNLSTARAVYRCVFSYLRS